MDYNYYKILGVRRSASDAEVKTAFRSKAKKYHPDTSSDGNTHAYFQVLNEAYKTLSDPIRRHLYDQTLGWEPEAGKGAVAGSKSDQNDLRRERRKRNAEYSRSVHRPPVSWEPPKWVKQFFYLVGITFGGFTMVFSSFYLYAGDWNPIMIWVPLMGFLIFLDAASGLVSDEPILSVRLFQIIRKRSQNLR